jgi:sigma-B regulation protein RsbU (phosphoserine phosphatase)
MMGMLGILFLAVVIALISGSITRPLRKLVRTTKHIATGNFDFEMPEISSGDEVGKLARSFKYMKNALKKYIRELTETTAAKERMESELKVAHDIQMGIVPKVFPPFPGRTEFDIYATLAPAKEVGGDLYDYFFIDDDHLCFIIGDVAGKGVPAALFMAMAITLLKATAKTSGVPAEILTRINKELSRGNDSCMFVTIFCAVLNIKTGELRYANAGHNPPLIVPEGGSPGFLGGDSGPVVGVDEGAKYSTNKIDLKAGDTVCMYTDGVTEAFSEDGGMFSEEGLERVVAASSGEPVEGVVAGILNAVKQHAVGVPQFDDITIMVLRYNHRDGEAEDETGSEK